jgi:hypothetical protein
MTLPGAEVADIDRPQAMARAEMMRPYELLAHPDARKGACKNTGRARQSVGFRTEPGKGNGVAGGAERNCSTGPWRDRQPQTVSGQQAVT